MQHLQALPLGNRLAIWARQHRRLVILLAIAPSLLIYGVAFRFLHAILGPGACAVAVLPVAIVAWAFGAPAGFAMSVAATILSLVLMPLVAETDLPYILRGGGAIGFAVLILVGVVVGKVSDLRSSLRNELAARQEAEEQLVRERQLLRTVIDNLPLAAYAKDLQGRKTMTNPSDLAWMGAQNEREVLGKTDAEIYQGEQARVFLEHDDYVLTDQEPVTNYEAWLEHPQGHRVYILSSKVPLLGPDGDMVGIVGVTQDITERKLAEEALRESEKRFRRIVETSMEGIWEDNTESRLTYVNARMAQMLGYSPEEMIGQLADTFIHPDELDAHRKMRLRRHQGLSDTYERRMLGKEGQEVWTLVSATPIFAAQDGYVGSFAMIRDITDEKRAEIALRESRDRLRRLAESAAAILWQYDIDNDRWTYVAPQSADILGYPPDAWTDMAFWIAHLHPEDREWASQYCAECTAQGRDHEFEYRFLAADGRVVWIRDVVSVEKRAGRPALLHGFMLDITEQKGAEEALQNERALLRTVIDHLPMAIYAKDLEGRKTLANRQDWESIGAVSPDEVLGRSDWELYPPELAEQLVTGEGQILESGEPLIVDEMLVERPSGRQEWLSSAKYPLRDAEDRVVGLVGMTQDISERKRAELVLRESEKRARRQRAALTRLAVDPALLGADLPQAMARLAETLGKTLRVQRAGVWLLAPDDSTLRCVALFQDGHLQPTEGLEIRVADYPAYFAAMRSRGQIYTQDARVDERTRELSEAYLEPLGIVSLLEAGIQVDGQLVGVVSCEHQGEPRAWHPDEGVFTSSAAALAAQVLVSAQRRDAELALRESEDRYRRLAENAPDLIYRYRLVPEPGFTYVNPAATRLVGYTPAEHYADPALGFKLVHPDDRHLLEAAVRGDTGKGEPLELRWIHKDGHVVSVEQRNVTIFDQEGKPVAIEGIARDITERKRADAALARERQLLRTVIDNLPASVYAKDLQGRKTLANKANLAILGVTTEEEALGKTDRDFYPAEIAARFEANDRHVFTTGLPTLNKEHPLSGEANTRWVMTSKLPLRDESGEIIGLVGITYDITERKAAEQERLQTERQLFHTQKLESLGVLAGGVAHDFGNLLMAILGNLTLALPDLPTDSTARESILLAMQAGQRAADVARQMLTYSGRGQVQQQPVSLSALVHENAHMLRVAIPKTVTLDLDLVDDLPAIKADPGQIQQVVINLITNASEAIGSQPGRIHLSTGMHTCDDAYLAHSMLQSKPPAGKYVYLQIADTGCGIAPETVHRIFEPFYSTKSPGRGLGMAAVQGIVTGHAGAILVDSVPDKGTTVRVLFPVVKERPAGEAPQTAAAAAPGQPVSPSSVSNGHVTVLVVDDEELVLQAAQRLLNRLGYRTLAAENGDEALAIYRKHATEIDCVLLDLTMPGRDGASTFAALHQLDPKLPVVLCSGYSEQEIGANCDRDRLAGFIQKPYSIELLSEIIQGALEVVSR